MTSSTFTENYLGTGKDKEDRDLYERERKENWEEGLFWMGETGTRADLSLPESLSANNSVSRLVLSNNLLYSLYFFASESVHSEKNFTLKMACVE